MPIVNSIFLLLGGHNAEVVSLQANVATFSLDRSRLAISKSFSISAPYVAHLIACCLSSGRRLRLQDNSSIFECDRI